VSFLVFINADRIFSSEMKIMIIPRNETIAVNMDEVINNAEKIPLTLSFYDEITQNEDINDLVLELPANKRKEFWDFAIKTERDANSGIIKITNFNADRVQAEIINRQSTSTLISRLSQYYDINKDVDIRIIEEPIINSLFGHNTYMSLLYSIILGVISGFLTSFVFSIIPASQNNFDIRNRFNLSLTNSLSNLPPIFRSKEKEVSMEKYDEFIDFNKQPLSVISQKTEKKQEDSKKNPETFVSLSKKATAPGNLPIADETVANEVVEKLYTNTVIPEEESEAEKKEAISQEPKFQAPKKEEPKKDIFREATPEEIKERLNKLLGGKL
jgi:hypothetical protein